MINKKPNFLLIGAPKSGTTSIANHLGEHPEVYMSEEKEPFYFIADILNGVSKDDPMLDDIMKKARLSWSDYIKLFSDSKNEKYRGEATVHYLYHYKSTIPKIKSELGDIPIIIVLRDPVERAFSNYMYQSRGQMCSFEEALRLEDIRKDKKWNSFWYYRGSSCYCDSVSSYIDNFSRVHVCFFEVFKEDGVSFMQNIYAFLGIDKTYVPKVDVIYNQTVVPVNKYVQFVYYIKHKYKLNLKYLPVSVKKMIRNYVFKKNKNMINEKTGKQLYEYFLADIECLEEKISIDLREWKSRYQDSV